MKMRSVEIIIKKIALDTYVSFSLYKNMSDNQN